MAKDKLLHYQENIEGLNKRGLTVLDLEQLEARGFKLPHVSCGVMLNPEAIANLSSDAPVIIRSLLAVPSNRMPLRLPAYILEALDISAALKKNNVPISEISLFCPLEINALVNNTDPSIQKTRLEKMKTIAEYLKSQYIDLRNTPLNFDQGHPPINDLAGQAAMVRSHSDGMLYNLAEMAYKHSDMFTPDTPFDNLGEDLQEGFLNKSALYLGEHGPSWHWTKNPGLTFDSPKDSGQLTLAYAPQSEARFLAAVADLVKRGADHWNPAIVLFSRNHVLPPYYPQAAEIWPLSLDLDTNPTLPSSGEIFRADRQSLNHSNSLPFLAGRLQQYE